MAVLAEELKQKTKKFSRGVILTKRHARTFDAAPYCDGYALGARSLLSRRGGQPLKAVPSVAVTVYDV